MVRMESSGNGRRKTAAQRGYGRAHKQSRRKWSQLVEVGLAICVRCGRPVKSGQKWHLDHADHPLAHQLGLYLGVSHAWCNVAARNRRYPRQVTPPRAKALDFFDVPPLPKPAEGETDTLLPDFLL
jgi:hypothetical protein